MEGWNRWYRGRSEARDSGHESKDEGEGEMRVYMKPWQPRDLGGCRSWHGGWKPSLQEVRDEVSLEFVFALFVSIV